MSRPSPRCPSLPRSIGKPGNSMRLCRSSCRSSTSRRPSSAPMIPKRSKPWTNSAGSTGNCPNWTSRSHCSRSSCGVERRWSGREAKLGRDHLQTVHAAANLGVNYRDAGRLKEAIPLLEEAHQAAKKNAELRWAGTELLTAYGMAGENAKLADLVPELLTEARKSLPKDSPQLAQQLATASMALLQTKAFAEAEPLLRECLAIREKAQPDAWSTFNTKSSLGGALLGQKKYADAEPLLLAGYEGMKEREKTIPPQGKDRLTQAIERLVQLCEAMGKKDDAANWRKELDAAKAAQEKSEKMP